MELLKFRAHDAQIRPNRGRSILDNTIGLMIVRNANFMTYACAVRQLLQRSRQVNGRFISLDRQRDAENSKTVKEEEHDLHDRAFYCSR